MAAGGWLTCLRLRRRFAVGAAGEVGGSAVAFASLAFVQEATSLGASAVATESAIIALPEQA